MLYSKLIYVVVVFIFTHVGALVQPNIIPLRPRCSSKRLSCSFDGGTELDTAWAMGIVAMVTQQDSFDFMPQHLPVVAHALVSLLARAFDAAAAASLPPQTLQLFSGGEFITGYCDVIVTSEMFLCNFHLIWRQVSVG